PDCELTLPEDTDQVSRRHAQIELTSQGAFVTDLGSSNGTFVNEQRLTRRTSVQAGSRIQLGHTGPVLEVREVELASGCVAPPPLPAATTLERQPHVRAPAQAIVAPLAPVPQLPSLAPWLIAGAAGIGLLMVALLVLVLRLTGNAQPESAAGSPLVNSEVETP